ncbi:acyl-CoA N-acyltransferase [Dendryphion nanum]|uniref:Acyl-CoA N-acyltransferase n=1 Tax=Dendryphion nanum TaxID=256645 RepID=A0A9P9EDM8_9PLEO|nr:acyl-CoA N-acyltransferase [Dendryphion nanum]
MAASVDGQEYIVRPARSVEDASSLWWPLMKVLGWNRDHNDAQTHYHVARKGADWLLLTSRDTQKPQGCVVAFTYPNGTGWVGFFIVSEALRGKGLGRFLWNGMDASFKASGTTIIGLDGVLEQVKTYERRGFVDVARIPVLSRPSLKQKPLVKDLEVTPSAGENIEDIRSIDTRLLAQLDFANTGLDRSALWTEEALFSRNDAFGYALLSADKNLLGYVLVRRCEHGHRFGPLYADTYEQAQLLLHIAMNKILQSEGSMAAEILGSNPSGLRVFEELGWEHTGVEYHRMWLGGRVPEEQQKGGKGTRGMFAIFDASQG